MTQKPATILFVCTGNVCRSPMAEALMRHQIAGRNELRVESVGLGAPDGAPPSANAVEAMRQLGLDIAGHRSRSADIALLHDADFIFVMSHQHLGTIELLYPEVAEKTFLVREFEPGLGEYDKDIADPIGQSLDVYLRCRDQIRAALPNLMKFIEQTRTAAESKPAANPNAPRVAIAADHGGFLMKNKLRQWLDAAGYVSADLGPHSLDPNDDYPDFAHAVASKVSSGRADFGVLICRSSIGMAITANRYHGVRAAQVADETEIRLSRQHNNANVLALSGDHLDVPTAQRWLQIWLNTPFDGGRHARRVEKIDSVSSPLAIADPAVFSAIQKEKQRQQENIELIASENFTSPAILEAAGSVLTNKYAEGYPGKRYYGGCEFVDIAEQLAIDRAKQLFGAEHANVQPHSGSQANMAVYFSTLQPGDTILTMELAHGGHLTHGFKLNFSGRLYKVIHYGVRKDTELIDYDQLATLAKEHKQKMITAGASAYSRVIDWKKMREAADSCGALLFVDMAHIAGLVAAGIHPSPVPYADFVTTTTHKTLRGPRAGLVLCRAKYAKEIDSMVLPGIQGGPLMHIIAAKAVCFLEALRPEFKEYQRQIVKNAQALAAALTKHGFRIISGGTDNHLSLVDLRPKKLTGKIAQEALDRAGITVNKNLIPYDPEKPLTASGIRVGSPAVTTRGMKEPEMEQIAALITEALENHADPATAPRVKDKVRALTAKFPLPY